MDERRKEVWTCPTCGAHFRARRDNMIVCLAYGCIYETEAKRREDFETPTIMEIRQMEGTSC